MFTSFAIHKKSRSQIAAELNAEKIYNARGRPWMMQTIDLILKSERYIGHNVYNQSSFKLQQKRVINPTDMWIRRDNAFRAIVSPELFAKAQKRLLELERGRKRSDQELLDLLVALWRKKGHLSVEILIRAEVCPSLDRL